jgi:hypothetical protein
MMYLKISSKLRRVRLDEKKLLCGEAFAQDSDDLSNGIRAMLDARELPEGMGEGAPENDPAEDAIRPSGT